MIKEQIQVRQYRCPRCGCTKPKVEVHGHYQCIDCKCVIEDCCQGERTMDQ